MSAEPEFKTLLDLPAAEAKTGDEVLEVVQDGESRQITVSDLLKVDRYDLAVAAVTTECDLAAAQVFKIDNTVAGAKAVTFVNAPSDRAATVVIKVAGKAGSITWPGGIQWNQNTAPEMGNTSTTIVLFWDGSAFVGSQGATI